MRPLLAFLIVLSGVAIAGSHDFPNAAPIRTGSKHRRVDDGSGRRKSGADYKQVTFLNVTSDDGSMRMVAVDEDKKIIMDVSPLVVVGKKSEFTVIPGELLPGSLPGVRYMLLPGMDPTKPMAWVVAPCSMQDAQLQLAGTRTTTNGDVAPGTYNLVKDKAVAPAGDKKPLDALALQGVSIGGGGLDE